MNAFDSIAVVIPAFRSNHNLIKLIDAIRVKFQQTIIVVDDGNQDQSIFLKLKDVIVLHHQTNQGKGAALKTAFRYVIEHLNHIEGVVTADADGQHPAEDIQQFIQLLDQDNRPFYLATRTFDRKTPLSNRLGNLITRKIFSWVTGQTLLDTQNGLRGIPRWLLPSLISIPEQRYDYEMAMLKNVANQKTTIIQVPTQTIYHQEGAVSSFNPWKDSMMIYRILLKNFIRFLFVGVLSFGLDFTLYLFIYQLLSGAWRIILSVVFARLISGIFNYMLNRFYSFQSDAKFVKSSLQYIFLFFIVLTSSAFGTDFIVFLGLSHTLAKPLIDIFLFFISYQVQKRYIFQAR
jgi:glycosyltransferase involved in cell wall biosynthesis